MKLYMTVCKSWSEQNYLVKIWSKSYLKIRVMVWIIRIIE